MESIIFSIGVPIIISLLSLSVVMRGSNEIQTLDTRSEILGELSYLDTLIVRGDLELCRQLIVRIKTLVSSL